MDEYGEACSLGGLVESQLIPPPSLYGREGPLFPGCGPPNDMLDFEYVVGIKLGESGVVIRY